MDDQANQRWGDIAGYAIAAKTGTASEPRPPGQKPCPKTNPLCVHGSSYIGMAPGNGPQVVVAVNVQDPKTNTDYFGDDGRGPGLLQRDELRAANPADPAATRTCRTLCSAQCALILDTLWA